MKITRLEAIKLKPLAMRQAFSTTNVLLNSLHFVLVRIETDRGIEGYGEALPAWEVTGETADSVAGCIALYQDPHRLYADDLLVGRDIGSLGAIRAMMDDLLPTGRPFTVMGNAAAKAAIEQAALDACARLQGVSIPALLGITPAPVASATANTRSRFFAVSPMYLPTTRERSTQYKSWSTSAAKATPSVRSSARDWPDNNNLPPATFAFAAGLELRSRLLAVRTGVTTDEDSFAGTTLRLDDVVIVNRCFSDT